MAIVSSVMSVHSILHERKRPWPIITRKQDRLATLLDSLAVEECKRNAVQTSPREHRQLYQDYASRICKAMVEREEMRSMKTRSGFDQFLQDMVRSPHSHSVADLEEMFGYKWPNGEEDEVYEYRKAAVKLIRHSKRLQSWGKWDDDVSESMQMLLHGHLSWVGRNECKRDGKGKTWETEELTRHYQGYAAEIIQALLPREKVITPQSTATQRPRPSVRFNIRHNGGSRMVVTRNDQPESSAAGATASHDAEGPRDTEMPDGTEVSHVTGDTEAPEDAD